MRISVIAVGRAARDAPERALVDDYLQRAGALGGRIGIGAVELAEVEDRQNRNKRAGEDARRMVREGELLLSRVPAGAYVVALDPAGKHYDSAGFARWIGGRRDTGTGDLAFVIGGAAGLGAAVLERADGCLSLGKMVWPHLLARVMLAEQVYRSVTILANHPYHRS